MTNDNRNIVQLLEKQRTYWQKFFEKYGVETKPLPELRFKAEKLHEIQKDIEAGFDFLIFMDSELNQRIEELHDRLTKDYKKSYIWFTPSKAGLAAPKNEARAVDLFPNGILNKRPKKGFYLVLTKSLPEIDDIWQGISAEVLREDLGRQNLTGLTLTEYLIFQKDFTERHGKHPDQKKRAWLLDSTWEPAASESGREVLTLEVYWSELENRLGFGAVPSSWAHPDRGVRLAKIIEIE